MSGTTFVFNPAGPTVALAVANTLHAAVPLALFPGVNSCNAVSVWNPNAGVTVAVALGVQGPAAVIPVDGTPGTFALPPSMPLPVVLIAPVANANLPVQITAIGSVVGPSTIYATPLVMQT